MTDAVRLLQVCPSLSQRCGIALFAEALERRLDGDGFAVRTVSAREGTEDADLVLLQHHPELMSDDAARAVLAASGAPTVLFAHEGGVDPIARCADGAVAMAGGLLGPDGPPSLVIPHPAWTPPALEGRHALRAEFGLPLDAPVAAANGFLRFERQFEVVAAALLDRTRDWVLDLVLSPWRLPSPGVLEALHGLRRRYGRRLRVQCRPLAGPTLNRRLQAADLLWCWTGAPSSPYASGVASDQYASGTRIVAADKRQHGHILSLPNVVRAPPELPAFLEALTGEMGRAPTARHDPAPVSWRTIGSALGRFLAGVAARPRELPRPHGPATDHRRPPP